MMDEPIYFRCAVDAQDWRDIQRAVAMRERNALLPDADVSGCELTGRTIAEICRGWMEFMDKESE
jgi:hypothetical protein